MFTFSALKLHRERKTLREMEKERNSASLPKIWLSKFGCPPAPLPRPALPL